MAKIKEEDIDALRERADMVEIVSSYTALKKASGTTFKGLCPFHSEKTPSFTVDAAKGLYHCFGCSEGGNLYHFVQKIENLPFPDAVEWLARKVGFDLRYEEARPGDEQRRGLKARIVAANEEAARFFHRTLLSSDSALDARRYLDGRGFGKEVAERWLLGYAPGRDALCKHLLAKRFSREEIEAADLGRISDRDGTLYDTFRQRITFPTWNPRGDLVAFGARALGDQQPKYLNTKETPVFSKSRLMFGLDRAKSAIARGRAVVVEGYTDVIALHEAGVTEAVATNGVALGESHFELLKKWSQRAVLMFDADTAGKGATERGFSLQYRLGMEVLVAPLPAGMDPADLVKRDGAEGIEKVIEAGQPLLQFKLEQTLDQTPLDTPEARARAVRAAVEVLGWHPDPIARHEYSFMVAKRIGVDPEVIHVALDERRSGDPDAARSGDRDRDRRLPGHVKVEREALQLLLMRTPQAADWADQVGEPDFSSPARRELFRQVTAALADGRSPVGADLVNDLSPDARSLFTELTVGADIPFDEDLEGRIQEVFVRLKVFRLERGIKKRRETLQDINPQDDPQRYDGLFVELVGLEAERRDLLRRL